MSMWDCSVVELKEAYDRYENKFVQTKLTDFIFKNKVGMKFKEKNISEVKKHG